MVSLRHRTDSATDSATPNARPAEPQHHVGAVPGVRLGADLEQRGEARGVQPAQQGGVGPGGADVLDGLPGAADPRG